MRLPLFIIFILFFTFSSSAQIFNWARDISDNTPLQSAQNCQSKHIKTDAVGNVYSIGNYTDSAREHFGSTPYFLTSDSIGLSVFIRKHDSSGNLIWIKSIDANTSIFPEDLEVVNNELYIVGRLHGSADFDPGPGVVNKTALGIADVFLLKLDTACNYLWAKTLAGSSYAFCNGVALDQLGNIYITGNFTDTLNFGTTAVQYPVVAASGATYVAKYTSAGSLIWVRTIGSSASRDIVIDSLGDIVITGNFQGTVDFDPGVGVFNLTAGMSTAGPATETYILKLDTAGTFHWALSINGGWSAYPFDLETDHKGRLYLIYRTSSLGNGHLTLAAYSKTGQLIWNTFVRIGGAVSQTPEGKIELDSHGGILVANTYEDFGSIYGMGISRFDTLGNEHWHKLLVNRITISDLELDDANNIFFTGAYYYAQGADFDPTPAVYSLNPVVSGGHGSFLLKWNGCSISSYPIITVSGCDSVSVNGFTYYTTNQHVQHYTNSQNCDSTVLLDVIIHPSVSDTINQMACDSFLFNGQMRYNSGIYKDTFSSQFMCDSIVYLNLTLNHSVDSIVTLTACDSLVINGQTYTSSGTYTQLYTNSLGCDSMFTINLTINNSSSNALAQTGCDSLVINGQTYTSSGTYTQLFTNSQGCDSTLTLNLNILHPTTSTITQTGCDSLVINSQTYTSSGTYTQLLTNSQGCDSTLTLNLNILHPTTSTITQTGCDSLVINNQTYTSSGTYTQLLTNSQGCDSILVIHATINQSTTSSITDTATNSYTLNGQTYTSSGTYTQLLTNTVGCDSTLTLYLTINSITPVITQNALVLTANPPGGIYQWVRCNPFQLISGANAPSYTVTSNGQYAVIVNLNGLIDTSACITVTNVGVDDVMFQGISVYPNPVNDKLFIRSTNILKGARLQILNATGQVVYRKENLTGVNFEVDMKKYSSGLYIIELSKEGSRQRIKVLKQ